MVGAFCSIKDPRNKAIGRKEINAGSETNKGI